MKKPNVLFLFSDQHKASVVGYENHPDVRTPHLDKLAKEGTQFSRAYSQDAVCVPSRCSMMTGLYPRTLGCLNNGDRTEAMKKALSLPSALQANGYHTAAFGKRHTFLGCDEGWSEVAGHLPDESPENYLTWIEAKGLGDVFARDWAAEWGHCPPGSIREGQKRPPSPLSAQVSELPPDATMEAFTAQHTIAYLKQRSEDGKPFFCWANFIRPHQPYTPPAKYMKRFDSSKWGRGANANDGIAKPESFDENPDHLPPSLRRQREAVDGTWCLQRCHEEEQLFRHALACYYACVEEVDQLIGEIMSALEASGLAENTIVIYGSDHGEFVGAHGMMEKCAWGHNVYEDSLRVPLIMRWPQHIREGVVCDGLAELVDLYPTILDFCGAEQPASPFALAGQSLCPVLKHGAAINRSFTVSENWSQASIVTPQWKLGHWLDPSPFADRDYRAFGDQLFDLEHDPYEMHNLLKESGNEEVVAELKQTLHQWLATIPDGCERILPQP
ncbi:sulfatase-like hydrolase/transferase [Kiritimatiellota bacterium B12222]|nr:sulfatase-like hydrolase/transferase [Kiritimatiellota bacterium B12222]